MEHAFVTAMPVPMRSNTASSVCKTGLQMPTSSPAITMRCRRDLKKEKSLRNLEFARAHRKRVVRRYNRRKVQEAVQNEDNKFLSSVFDTIRFGSNEEATE